AAQIAVGAPILGELDAGPGQLPGILLELAFDPLKPGDRVGGRPGKPGDDPAPTEPPDLLGIGFDDRLAHRHLTVAGDNDLTALAQRQDRRAVPGALFGGSGHALHVRSDNPRSSAAESLSPAIRERGLPFFAISSGRRGG